MSLLVLPVRFSLVLALGVLLTGCPNQVLVQEKSVADVDEQQATCKIAKDPLNPLIVEWPGTSKVDLDSASKRGVVVVSYAGCTLKVLASCSAGGDYGFTAVTPARDKLMIADQNELYARLPLGVASLKAELAMGSSLELDYIAVGQRIAEKPPRTLSGDCEGATHYVRTITVGAYSLDAKAAGKVGASVEVANAGGGLGREEKTRRLRGSGDVEACSAEPDSTNCGAVLQLGLSPLSASKGGQVTAAGFGSNIAPLTNIPTVSELREVGQVGAQSLRNVDIDYLTAVQDAKRSEKNNGSTQAKIEGWTRVRDMREEGDYHQVAETRVKEWSDVREAEVRRREQLEKLRTQYSADKSKLEQLMKLDDELVTKSQKIAYQSEFDAVYSPYKDDLAEVGVSSNTSTSNSGYVKPYSASADSDESGGSVTDAPKVDEEIFIIKGEVGGHAQSFNVDTDSDQFEAANGGDGSEPQYALTGLVVGGHLAFNFSTGDDMAVGIMGFGRYYPNATVKAEGLESAGAVLEPAGAFAVGTGLRLAGNIGDQVGMNLGLEGGIVSFLLPEGIDISCGGTDDGTGTITGTTEYDPSALGGVVNVFLGFDFYPLQFLSLGVTASLGWGHVGADRCLKTPENPLGVVVSTFGEQFSATGVGNLGLHF